MPAVDSEGPSNRTNVLSATPPRDDAITAYKLASTEVAVGQLVGPPSPRVIEGEPEAWSVGTSIADLSGWGVIRGSL